MDDSNRPVVSESGAAAPRMTAESEPVSKQAAPPLAWRWWPYVAPLAVFMVVGSLEPTPAPHAASAAVESEEPAAEEHVPAPPPKPAWANLTAIEYRWYPLVYLVKIALTFGAMAAAWPMYRSFRWRLGRWAVLVGALGAVVWIGLCRLRLESSLLAWAGLADWADFGVRGAYNPLAELAGHPAWAGAFLLLRFTGLVIVAPVIEEFFLRGFLARLIVHPNWWSVPFGHVNAAALVGLTVFPLLTHPGEMLAALVWFSGITWLMVRTRNIWDCVVAHATTNLLLGIYVVASGDWRLM